VKVRIEIGPKDAAQNACMVARSQAIPGKVAYKRTSEVGVDMCTSVTEMLHMLDDDVPKGRVEKYVAKKQEKNPQQCAST